MTILGFIEKTEEDESFLNEVFKSIDESEYKGKGNTKDGTVTIVFDRGMYHLIKDTLKMVMTSKGLKWNYGASGWIGEKGSVIADFEDRTKPIFKLKGDSDLVDKVVDFSSKFRSTITYEGISTINLEDTLPRCYRLDEMKSFISMFYYSFRDWSNSREKAKHHALIIVVMILFNKKQAIEDIENGLEPKCMSYRGLI